MNTEIRSDSITIWNSQGLWLDLTWSDVLELKRVLGDIEICYVCKLPIPIESDAGMGLHSGCYQYLIEQTKLT